MTSLDPLRLALGGHLAIAAALGIGRFVYTPILPSMIDALGWSNVDAGLVASANFLGYLLGALAAGQRVFATTPGRWMVIALGVSAATTAAMGLSAEMAMLAGLRFLGGLASAFVLVCASTLVLGQLLAAGRGELAAVHFGGMGVGVVASSAAVSSLVAVGADWRLLWIVAGFVAAVLAALSAHMIGRIATAEAAPRTGDARSAGGGIGAMILSYGLFGFGYVVTATFLVTIVRRSGDLRPVEPWVWMLFGGAAIPSVWLWQRLARSIGLMRSYAAACLVEAVGVVVCVEWSTIAGVAISAILLGGTILGITALGLMSGQALAGGKSQRLMGYMTASFGVGQMTGPSVAGYLYDMTGSFRSASLLAAAMLVVAAALAVWTSSRTRAPDGSRL